MSAWLRHTGYSSQLQATSPAPPPRHWQQHACPLTGVDALFDEQQYVPYFNKGGKKKPPNAARLQQYRKQTNVARLLWTHGPVWRVELEPGSLKLSSVAESHLTPLPDAATLAQLYAGVQLSEVAPPLGAELPTTERRLAYARGDVHPKTLEPWTFGYIPPVPAPAPAAAPSIPTTGDDDEFIVKIPDVDEDSAKTTNKALLDFCAAHDIPVPFSTTGKEGRERLVEHVKNIKYRLKTWPDETIVGKLAYTPATHGYRKPVVGAQEWHRKVPLSDELHKLVQQLPIDNALIDRYCSLPGVLKRSKMWWRDGKCQTMGLLADVGTWLEPSGTRYDVIALRMITWASQESENGKPVEHNNTVGFIRRAGSGEPFDLWVRLFSCCVSSLPCAHGLCTLTAAWELKTAASAARYRETVKQPLPPPHGSMVVRLDDCVVLQQGPGSQRKRKGNVVADEEAKDYLGERHLESMQQKDVLESSAKVDTEMESLRHGWGSRRANSGRKSLPLSERSEGSDAHRMAEHRAALRAAAPAAAPAAATGVVSLPDDERFGEPSMVRMLGKMMAADPRFRRSEMCRVYYPWWAERAHVANILVRGARHGTAAFASSRAAAASSTLSQLAADRPCSDDTPAVAARLIGLAPPSVSPHSQRSKVAHALLKLGSPVRALSPGMRSYASASSLGSGKKSLGALCRVSRLIPGSISKRKRRLSDSSRCPIKLAQH